MKNTVIEQPSEIRGEKPRVILSGMEPIDTIIGETVLNISGMTDRNEEIEISYVCGEKGNEKPTVSDWEIRYATLIELGSYVTLTFKGVAFDYKYELNKSDCRWYLVKQGPGLIPVFEEE
ncbi:hypothetical protein [Terribacillus sp. DMT04]|uniref:hypothetical protein n=1 Tax=Terribacillus TaxID=459532 RepID=UPI001C2C455C|nr:hypothetical protein [Terribacillus sp. DMT04]QXE03553.1 hypothetical protein KS242_17920 [Terribacillus sp. DMT04]